MSFSTIGDLNWLAVIVGAAIYFAIGAVWFTPMGFGRPWQRAMGWDPNRTPPQRSAALYATPVVAYLLVAIATGMLAIATGSDTFGSGLVLGLVAGIGYAATILAVTATFDPGKPQPWVWFSITAAYHVLGILVVAVLVSVWH